MPRTAPLRWDPSYGGEDGVFCADALAAGLELVFDPRFQALGPALLDPVPNPFFGIPGTGEFGTRATIQAGQLLRPFPQFRERRRF